MGKSTKSYTVPNGVVKIAEHAFAHIEGSLNSVTLPKSVSVIDYSAFYAGLDAYVGEAAYGDKTSIKTLTINNRSCKINEHEDEYNKEGYTIFKSITIRGYDNSTAQAYAKKYKKKFVIISDRSIPSAGTILKNTSSAKYQVTKVGQTVAFAGLKKKKAKSVTIPDTIKVNGIKYKVTSVKANAFKNNKKLTKVVIGKNIKTIGKKAFIGCRKLKNITIKTKKLTAKSIGAKAFAKAGSSSYKKLVVKVPKSKKKAYKKLFRKKGLSKKVRIR